MNDATSFRKAFKTLNECHDDYGRQMRGHWGTPRGAARDHDDRSAELRFHDLRHSHATLLLTAGVNPEVVEERLGYESVKTTLYLYFRREGQPDGADERT